MAERGASSRARMGDAGTAGYGTERLGEDGMAMQANKSTETIFVSKLRRTETIERGRIKQTFDVVNLPGMQVVCVSAPAGDGDFDPVSQEYHLVNGAVFDNPDDALLAWDTLVDEIALLDAIGAALLRHAHGLIRPLWEHRTPEAKWPWITRARQFKGIAESLGLSITKEPRR